MIQEGIRGRSKPRTGEHVIQNMSMPKEPQKGPGIPDFLRLPLAEAEKTGLMYRDALKGVLILLLVPCGAMSHACIDLPLCVKSPHQRTWGDALSSSVSHTPDPHGSDCMQRSCNQMRPLSSRSWTTVSCWRALTTLQSWRLYKRSRSTLRHFPSMQEMQR